MARSLFGFVVVAALAALQVKAMPRTNVTCIAQQWSFNSLQQSPCLVSAYLSAQCTSDDDWLVPEIGTEGPYSPPSGQYANLCRCNSVQWNLLSACSLCQGGPSGSWMDWMGNCSASVVNVASYPLPIPSGVAIPHWAYYDFTGINIFNAATGPESSPAAIASSTPAYSSVGFTASYSVAVPSATPLPSGPKSNSSGNNTGAIVGGIVGGVLGVAVLVLIAVMLVRKSKQSPAKIEPQNQDNHSYPTPVPVQPNSASPMMGQYQPGMPHPGLASPGPDQKPYDPSDPATFPVHQSYAASQYPHSLNYSQHPSQYQPGQYHGAPEV
ncbi:hypothetical protein FRC10_009284 [Ceratobasidium sp. 414]|nr:hypothetical protein FRC10_009284 [Ceratobasidium sp. 414]